MRQMNRSSRLSWCALAAMILLATFISWQSPLGAQQEAGPRAETPDANREGGAPGEGDGPPVVEREAGDMNLWGLMLSGGFFMLPILALSAMAGTFAIERAFALRRGRVIPAGLVEELGALSERSEGFDPREAYKICQRYPSAAANVIRAMLLKVGRPHSEVEHAVAEASQREAERLHANVRYLTLAAAVAPLLGLLGTVWGLIQAFYDTTQLLPGMNKAEQLAKGIYLALVTTFFGLVVAIPSAILSHFFEGRLQSLFHEIDDMLFHMLPQIERYEGRVRFTSQAAEATPPAAAVPEATTNQ